MSVSISGRENKLGERTAMSKRNKIILRSLVLAVVLVTGFFGLSFRSSTTTLANGGRINPPRQLDTKKIDQIIGRSGELRGNVYKIGLPRTDLKVTVDGETIKPGLALGSWMAFTPSGEHAMVMGDLVLLESELTPVLSRLGETGIEVSAIHNHVLNEQPRVVYLHESGTRENE